VTATGGLKRMTELCKTRLPEGLMERAEKARHVIDVVQVLSFFPESTKMTRLC